MKKIKFRRRKKYQEPPIDPASVVYIPITYQRLALLDLRTIDRPARKQREMKQHSTFRDKEDQKLGKMRKRETREGKAGDRPWMELDRSSPWSVKVAMSDEECVDLPSPPAAGDENPLLFSSLLLGLLASRTLPLSPSYLWAAASIQFQSNPSRKKTENQPPPFGLPHRGPTG